MSKIKMQVLEILYVFCVSTMIGKEATDWKAEEFDSEAKRGQGNWQWRIVGSVTGKWR